MSRSYMFNDKTKENRRKEREDQQVELRQVRREELLNKKRVLSVVQSDISNLQDLKVKLFSTDSESIHQAVYEFRTILSVESNPPIQSVLDSGCMPRFVQLLGDSNSRIRIEAAWVMTNIAAGSSMQTQVVIDSGAVPPLVAMLYDEEEQVIDQAVWALGNIAGDSEKCRDEVLGTGALNRVVELLEAASSIKLVRNLTWLLSNLNRGRKPAPTPENMKKSLGILMKLVESPDSEVVCDSFWALSYIVDVDLGCTDLVLGSAIMQRCYDLLDAYACRIRHQPHEGSHAKACAASISPIIRMLGNVATGSDEQTGVIVRMGFLRFFGVLFYGIESRKANRIRKEICWTLSNITAGPLDQVKSVVDQDLLGLLVDAVSTNENFVRKEACWALSNVLFHSKNNIDWVRMLVDTKLVEGLQSYMWVCNNYPEMLIQILECYKFALEGGRVYQLKRGVNIIKERMVECEAVEGIEDLQNSKDVSVADKAYGIIAEYFEGDY